MTVGVEPSAARNVEPDGPAARYRRSLETGRLEPDPAQAEAVGHLQRIHDELSAAGPRPRGLLAGLTGLLGERRWEPVRGLYLWGGVGRGKTLLVHLLHDALPMAAKRRVHFHGFMQEVHERLKAHRHRPDPLGPIARSIAREARVLCFDEFHVSDIADAMLLGRLLDGLFERGVTLVATSNLAPDDLYRDGLQRERFLPAIAHLHRHTEVVELASPVDYRLRALERAEIYHAPLDDAARAALRRNFSELADEEREEAAVLRITGRPVTTERVAGGVVWFSFRELCDTPRGPADYIEIARRFHTLILEGIPLLGDESPDRTLRFIHLVDELYERRVNLIASACARPAELYRGRRLAPRFERTRSRLEEMQSHEYLAHPHLP